MATKAPLARLEARLPQETYALLREAADLQGRSLTDFIVTAARTAAQKAIADAQRIELSRADQLAFATALLKTTKPKPALRKAFQKRQTLVGNE
ncbi:MAG: DUF1778 domain-containing protein [Bryobacter sp.]|nr:DUF1778 domain-containing protein [Bryobacter sp.]